MSPPSAAGGAATAAYTYGVKTSEGGDMTGRAKIVGHRRQDPYLGNDYAVDLRWVNLNVPDDPWPDTLTIGLAWTCHPPS